MRVVIDITGEIGVDTTLEQIKGKIGAIDQVSEIDLHINSYGGSAFEGIAIYNYLRPYSSKLTATVLGVAASAASIIAMAASRIRMYDGSMIMIHNVWGVSIGSADQLEHDAEVYRKVDDAIVEIYRRRLGWPEDKIRRMMSVETWLDAKDLEGVEGVEVVDSGVFASSVIAQLVEATSLWNKVRGPAVHRGGYQLAASLVKEQALHPDGEGCGENKETPGSSQEQEEIMENNEIQSLKKELEDLKSAISQVVTPIAKVEATPSNGTDGKVVLRNGLKLGSLAEFLTAMVKAPQEVRAAVTPLDPTTDKGLAVPKVYIDELFYQLLDKTIVYPNATKFGTGLRTDVYVPRIDDPDTPAVTWKAQGAALDETDPDFGAIVLRPKVLGGVTYLSLGAYGDIGAGLEAQIRAYLEARIINVADAAFLAGSGTGNVPRGIKNSTAKVEVNRDQAGKVTRVDVANMLAKFLPSRIDNAVWVAHPSLIPELYALTNDTNGRLFVFGNPSAGVPDTLAGRPVYYSSALPSLDSANGDLILVDLSSYAVYEGMGAEVEFSFEAGFSRASVAMRAIWMTDGLHAQLAPASGLSTSVVLKKK